MEIDRMSVDKLNQRNLHYCENIGVLIVRNGFGETLGIYDAKLLARKWFIAGDVGFFSQYGFRWTPPESLTNRIKAG